MALTTTESLGFTDGVNEFLTNNQAAGGMLSALGEHAGAKPTACHRPPEVLGVVLASPLNGQDVSEVGLWN